MVRLRSLGDIVLETPAIAALHAWRPDLRIFVLIEKRFAAALEGNPGYRRTDLFARLFRNGRGNPPSQISYDLQPARRSAQRFAHRGLRRALSRRMERISIPLRLQRAGSGRRRVLRPAGCPHRRAPHVAVLLARVAPRADSRRASLSASRSARAVSRQILAASRRRRAVRRVATGSARWPKCAGPSRNSPKSPAGCADTHGIASVVNLSAASAPLSAEIRAAFANGAVNTAANVAVNAATIADSLPLPDLIALIRRRRLFVGNDSGPVHLAGRVCNARCRNLWTHKSRAVASLAIRTSRRHHWRAVSRYSRRQNGRYQAAKTHRFHRRRRSSLRLRGVARAQNFARAC